MTLSQRLRLLKAEVTALETELSDPSNPLYNKERELESGAVDPGDLIRGMVDVKGRLQKISKAKEGRGKLVSVVLGEERHETGSALEKEVKDIAKDKNDEPEKESPSKQPKPSDVKDVADMDRRVGDLEKIVGSSNTALDEVRSVLIVYRSASRNLHCDL